MSCNLAVLDGCRSKQVSNTSMLALIYWEREGENPASHIHLCASRALLVSLGLPVPCSLLPQERLQLHDTWPCWSNAQDQMRRRSRLPHRWMKPYGHRVLPHSCLFPGLQARPVPNCSFMRCVCCRTASRAGQLPSSPPRSVLRCFFPFLVPLPPEALPKGACFSQASMKPSNPARCSRGVLVPLLNKENALLPHLCCRQGRASHVNHCRDGRWSCLWIHFLGQTQC